MKRTLRSKFFWIPFLSTLVLLGGFFGWELGLLNSIFWFAPRAPGLQGDIYFSAILITLLSCTVGLLGWNARLGSCPRGMKRTTGFAGMIGVLTLTCPCIVLPASLLGLGVVFAALSPYMLILRVAAIALLIVAIWMLVRKGK